jgi:hypothetical protein
MEQGPSWETRRFSASQEIPRILWNPKIHFRIHNSLPPVPNLSQIILIYSMPSRSNPEELLSYYPPIDAWVFQI